MSAARRSNRRSAEMPPVSAVFLHAQPTDIDLEALVAPVRGWIADLDRTIDPDAPCIVEGEAVWQGERRYLQVTQSSGPVEPEIVQAALSHPLCELLFPTAVPIVDGHAAHTVITIGTGEADAVPEWTVEGMLPEAILDPLRTLKKISGAYLQQDFPLAVLWTQSGVFRGGADFAQFALNHSDGPNSEIELFVDVTPYVVQPDGMGPLIGTVTNGAMAVIGREVEMLPANVPLAWALDRTLQFVGAMAANGAKPETKFALDDGELLTIGLGEADERFPVAPHQLRVHRAPIIGTISPTEQATTDEPGAGDVTAQKRSAFGRRF